MAGMTGQARVIAAPFAAALFLVGAVAAQQPPTTYPEPFDRPGATKLFENTRVIVWDNVWQKGIAYPVHQHRFDMTGVFLRWGQVRVTTVDGRISGETGASAQPFDVPMGFFTLKGVTHKEETIGDVERHAIMVELKDPNPPVLFPPDGQVPAFPREGARQIFDTPRSVIWEYTYQAGTPGAPHFHDKDAVEVFLTRGNLNTVSGSDNQLSMIRANDVRFVARNQTHRETVVGETVRSIVIELK